MPDGVNPAMKANEPLATHTQVDRATGEARLKQLTPGHHTVLALSDGCDSWITRRVEKCMTVMQFSTHRAKGVPQDTRGGETHSLNAGVARSCR